MFRRILMRVSNINNSICQNPHFKYSIKCAFGKYLLLTNIVSSGVLMAVGDILRQEVEYRQKMHEDKRYNWNRLGRMFLVGLSQGPIHHYFYMYLDTTFPGTVVTTILKKIAMDQFIMSPACIVTFFYGMGLLEGKTLKKCGEEIKNKFGEVYMMDWIIWPAAQYLNFYLVPIRYQVLYINGVTALYNIFLSYIKHRDELPEIHKTMS